MLGEEGNNFGLPDFGLPDFGLPDFWSSDVNIFELCNPSVSVGGCDCRHLAIHVVLSLDKLAPVNLTRDRLTRYYVALGLEKKCFQSKGT